jgi:hypothetical protein
MTDEFRLKSKSAIGCGRRRSVGCGLSLRSMINRSMHPSLVYTVIVPSDTPVEWFRERVGC